MFGYCRRAVLCLNHNPNPNINPITVIPTHFSLLLPSFTSSSEQHSFTFNFLLNNCGFSPAEASKLSTRVRLVDSAGPDSVLALFTSHGFSNAQTRGIIQTYPKLLTYSAHNTLLPKLTFLRSKGASSSDLVHIITKNPGLLYIALENAITPRYHFIKRFTLSDRSTMFSVKSCPSIIHTKYAVANIQVLLENGVPESKVAMLLRYWVYSLATNTPTFKNALEEVKEFGFEPYKTVFILGLRAKLLSKSTWERKIGLYRKWGWSEEDFVSAFVRSPWCMLTSEHKIETMMEFFVNHLGWDSLMLAKYPVLMVLSLERRLIPRAFVLRFLQSRGLVKHVKSAKPFRVSEKAFLQRFVHCFEEEASQLLKMYQEKRDLPR